MNEKLVKHLRDMYKELVKISNESMHIAHIIDDLEVNESMYKELVKISNESMHIAHIIDDMIDDLEDAKC